MEPLKNQQLFDIIASWLTTHAFDFAAILLVAVVAYFLGTRIVSFIVKRAVKGARHRSWHKKDIEKRQKTLVSLFTSIWRIVILLTAAYSILRVFNPSISSDLAPLFASAGIIGIALGFGAGNGRVAMETQARGTSDDSGQAYGQIKRRQSAVDKAKREIDED